MLKLNNKFNKNSIKVVTGLLMVITSFILAYLWFTYFPTNPFIAVVTIGLLFGGGYLIKKYITGIGETQETIVIIGQTQSSKVKCNTLCLYPEKIEFTNMTKPLGQPWKCHNDNKPYYVQIWDEAKKELVEFILPDQQYMDPEYYAKRVLELPAHRRIFKRKQSMLEQLSPVMVIGCIIVFSIIMLATLG